MDAFKLHQQVIDNYRNTFTNNPVTVWLENKVTLHHHTDGYIERAMPKRLSEGTETLQKNSGGIIEKEALELKNLLQWAKLNIDAVKNSTGKTFLPFRFHQFISQNNTVNVTLDPFNGSIYFNAST